MVSFCCKHCIFIRQREPREGGGEGGKGEEGVVVAERGEGGSGRGRERGRGQRGRGAERERGREGVRQRG